MPIRSPEYDDVTSSLAPLLSNLPPKVVAVSGGLHAGKTTLSRYLAWYFNCTLIETDPYILSGPPYVYRNEEVERLIDFRLNTMRRPVFIEGIAVLQLFNEIGVTADYVVGVRSVGRKPFEKALSNAACFLDVVVNHQG